MLFAVTSYWMQAFPLPRKVTHVITKKAPVVWDKVCDPKNASGLNITSLKEWNQATIGKIL